MSGSSARDSIVNKATEFPDVLELLCGGKDSKTGFWAYVWGGPLELEATETSEETASEMIID